MSTKKRWAKATTVAVIICALVLALGVMPTVARMSDDSPQLASGTVDVQAKFPDIAKKTYPRMRTSGEMALLELSYGPLRTPAAVVATAEDETYTPELAYSVEELEQFRTDVVAYADECQAVVDALVDSPWAAENPELVELAAADITVASDEFYDSMALVGYEDLANAKTVFETDPDWRGRPAQLMTLLEQGESGLDYWGSGKDSVLSALGVTPQWSAWSPPTDYDGTIFTARYVAINAAIAMEILPDSITIVVLGAGTSIPNPLRWAAVAAWGVAENVVIYNESLQDNRDDYNTEYLIDHAHQTGDRVRDNLDMPVSDVNANVLAHNTSVIGRFNAVDSSLLGLENHLTVQDAALGALELHLATQDAEMALRFGSVDAELAAVRAQLDAQDTYLAETRTLMVRMTIEENLLSDAMPLAAFQLPAADGGQLDNARTIVAETIASMRAAGLSVNNADTELRRGDAAYAVGNYKEAYSRYRAAYREATR